jgi:hypothetical protein
MQFASFPRTLLALALVSLGGAACSPGGGLDDGGASDAGSTDAGPAPTDAGLRTDAGARDAGPSSDCPVINPFENPIGQACSDEAEGLVCKQGGCFAPGPNCLYIECRDGIWIDQAFYDAGPRDGGGVTSDAGETADDAGSDADAADDDDAGLPDAGGDDAG